MEIKLEARKRDATQLDGKFAEREKVWRAAVPRRLSARGRYMLSATDETNTIRFLPTYLCKCNPPRDIEDPMMVARMVNCAAARRERWRPPRAPSSPPAHSPPPTLLR